MDKYTRLINEVYNDVRHILNESEWDEYTDRSIYNNELDYLKNVEFYYNITKDLIEYGEDFYSSEPGDRVVPVTAYAVPDYKWGLDEFDIELDIGPYAYIVPEEEAWCCEDLIEEPKLFEGLTKQQKDSIISRLDPNDFWDI